MWLRIPHLVVCVAGHGVLSLLLLGNGVGSVGLPHGDNPDVLPPSRELITTATPSFEYENLTAPNSKQWPLPFCSTTKSATDVNVKMLLYTKKNKDDPETLVLNSMESVTSSNFRPGYPTVFFAHGFTESWKSPSSLVVKNAYMEQKSFVNFVVVDWCKLASAVGFWGNCEIPEKPRQPTIDSATIITIPYYTAACNTLSVGKHAAEMISFLVNLGYVDLTKLHFTGHSLGSHVAGVAGYHVQLLNNGKRISRITGLDPALPLFSSAKLEDRLDPTDAEFVDVIHTAGNNMFLGIPWSLGFLEPLGHVDFYPNAGKPTQPGCGVDLVNTCSHARSFVYYAESVTHPFAFQSCPCADYENCEAGLDCDDPIFMGILASPIVNYPMKTTFYTHTLGSKPFGRERCKNQTSMSRFRTIGHYVKRVLLADTLSKGPRIPAIQYMEPGKQVNGKWQPGYPVASVSFSSELNSEKRTKATRNYHKQLCPETGLPLLHQTPPEFNLPYYKLIPSDRHEYTWEDFDRGHLTPIDDFLYDNEDGPMNLMNSGSNLIPMDPFTNRVPWNRNVENAVRQHSKTYPGFVLTGVSKRNSHLTKGNAFVPDSVYKLYCYKMEGTVYVVGFYVRNSLIRKGLPPNDRRKFERWVQSLRRYPQKEIIEMSGRPELEEIWEDIGTKVGSDGIHSDGGQLLLRDGHGLTHDQVFDASECNTGSFNPAHWTAPENSKSGEIDSMFGELSEDSQIF